MMLLTKPKIISNISQNDISNEHKIISIVYNFGYGSSFDGSDLVFHSTLEEFLQFLNIDSLGDNFTCLITNVKVFDDVISKIGDSYYDKNHKSLINLLEDEYMEIKYGLINDLHYESYYIKREEGEKIFSEFINDDDDY